MGTKVKIFSQFIIEHCHDRLFEDEINEWLDSMGNDLKIIKTNVTCDNEDSWQTLIIFYEMVK